MAADNELAKSAALVEERRMAGKNNVSEITAFRVGGIQACVGGNETITLKEWLAARQEFKM
jgi:hypothetical protein